MKLLKPPLPLPIRNNLIPALLFGLCAFFIVKSTAIVHIGNTGTFIDLREIFSIAGGSLNVPWGGLIIGFFACVVIPAVKWQASGLTHLIGCVLVDLAYKIFMIPVGNQWTFFSNGPEWF
jgi:hypothetical protein